MKRALSSINLVLLTGCIVAVGHLGYRLVELRPRIVVNPPPDCVSTLAFDADYFAHVCQSVIVATGSLPPSRAAAAQVISDNATRLGLTWPNNFQINRAGEICDCLGNPYDILVTADRVSVSSASLYAFYFADLGNKSGGVSSR